MRVSLFVDADAEAAPSPARGGGRRRPHRDLHRPLWRRLRSGGEAARARQGGRHRQCRARGRDRPQCRPRPHPRQPAAAGRGAAAPRRGLDRPRADRRRPDLRHGRSGPPLSRRLRRPGRRRDKGKRKGDTRARPGPPSPARRKTRPPGKTAAGRAPSPKARGRSATRSKRRRGRPGGDRPASARPRARQRARTSSASAPRRAAPAGSTTSFSSIRISGCRRSRNCTISTAARPRRPRSTWRGGPRTTSSAPTGARPNPALRPLDQRDVDFLAAYVRMPWWRTDLDAYARLFALKGDGLSGDITPDYSTLDASAIARIMARFPEARVVFIARDPVERVWSHLTMHMRAARSPATSTPEAVMRLVRQALRRRAELPDRDRRALAAACPGEAVRPLPVRRPRRRRRRLSASGSSPSSAATRQGERRASRPPSTASRTREGRPAGGASGRDRPLPRGRDQGLRRRLWRRSKRLAGKVRPLAAGKRVAACFRRAARRQGEPEAVSRLRRACRVSVWAARLCRPRRGRFDIRRPRNPGRRDRRSSAACAASGIPRQARRGLSRFRACSRRFAGPADPSHRSRRGHA